MCVLISIRSLNITTGGGRRKNLTKVQNTRVGEDDGRDGTKTTTNYNSNGGARVHAGG